jgi:hypothetical protein
MRVALVLLALVPGLASAETPGFRLHPDYAARMASVKSVGVTPAVVKVFEMTAGNNRVLRQDWSDRAVENVTTAVESALRARGLAVKRIVPTEATKAEVEDVQQLFDAVSDAILQATYAYRFPAKMARFEYSVGDLDRLLSASGVDAIVFAYGFGNISSGGRKAVQVLSAVVGGGVSYGIDRIFLAVADRSGAVLWFDAVASSGHDLRDAESTAGFVQKATVELPGTDR